MKYDHPLISKPTSLLLFLQKKRQQKEFRQTIEMSATFLLISFFLIFAIRPTVVTISALLADIDTKKGLAGQLKTKINSVIQAQTAYSQAQASYAMISSSLPDGYRFSQAATQIKTIGQKSNISTEKITFGLTKQDDSNQATSYTYNFIGGIDFDNIQHLISELTNNRRCLQLTGLSLSSQEKKKTNANELSTIDNQNQVGISIGTQIFYWKHE